MSTISTIAKGIGNAAFKKGGETKRLIRDGLAIGGGAYGHKVYQDKKALKSYAKKHNISEDEAKKRLKAMAKMKKKKKGKGR